MARKTSVIFFFTLRVHWYVWKSCKVLNKELTQATTPLHNRPPSSFSLSYWMPRLEFTTVGSLVLLSRPELTTLGWHYSDMVIHCCQYPCAMSQYFTFNPYSNFLVWGDKKNSFNCLGRIQINLQKKKKKMLSPVPWVRKKKTTTEQLKWNYVLNVDCQTGSVKNWEKKGTIHKLLNNTREILSPRSSKTNA